LFFTKIIFILKNALTNAVYGNYKYLVGLRMTTLTIRVDEKLKARAFKQAEKLGVPLTLVVKNALKNFIEYPQVIIVAPQDINVTPKIQKKMDLIAIELNKKRK
jgi:antitoxin component of RelBE/YafQ-DinJ toxin-antitoxin module